MINNVRIITISNAMLKTLAMQGMPSRPEDIPEDQQSLFFCIRTGLKYATFEEYEWNDSLYLIQTEETVPGLKFVRVGPETS